MGKPHPQHPATLMAQNFNNQPMAGRLKVWAANC
jgi:hypothetical protein